MVPPFSLPSEIASALSEQGILTLEQVEQTERPCLEQHLQPDQVDLLYRFVGAKRRMGNGCGLVNCRRWQAWADNPKRAFNPVECPTSCPYRQSN